ncbi:MAG: hypothetical protein KF803_13875 [Cyclobacteriaceae bacterium]|nr:hypothetical protein [Cyclobacteriaceae bacterium]
MKLTLITVLLSISVQIFANSPTTMAIVSNETSGIYKVVYQGQETGKVKMTILNNRQQVVFTEVIAQVSAFIRPYNFSGMEAGEYTIVLEDKTGKQVEKISYRKNVVVSTIHVAKLAHEDGKYILSATNNGTENILINIYDAKENIVYSKHEKVSGNFALIYNLKNVMSHSIRFEIVSDTGKVTSIVY